MNYRLIIHRLKMSRRVYVGRHDLSPLDAAAKTTRPFMSQEKAVMPVYIGGRNSQ